MAAHVSRKEDLASATIRRRRPIEHVGWRRIAGLIIAFVLLVLLVGWAGTREKHLGLLRWMDLTVLTSQGGTGTAIDPKSEVGRLAFEDGHAEFGRFSVKVFDLAAQRTLRADFEMEGKTNCEDKDAFQQFMLHNHRFLREQVAIAVRTSPPRDMIDPQLRLLRKRIQTRVNRALGQPFLSSVDLPGFTLHESVGRHAFRPISPAEPEQP